MKENSVCNDKIFAKIFNDQAKNLRNYLFYKFGNLKSAEDFTQESFIKLWQNCSKVPLQKVKSYLFTIATNLSINEKKHDKIVLRFNQTVNNNINKESPEFILREKEFLLKIQNCLDELPDGQREVFLLNRIDDKTYKEIAALLNISVKAVEKRMHKALLIIRKKIGNV